MANDPWTNIETPTIFARRTINQATAVPIGTVMKLGDDNTVVVSAADNDVFGGIAWVEAEGGKGITEIVVAMNGVWNGEDSGSGGSAGAIVNIGGVNVIIDSIGADLLTGSVVGKREMDSANNEVTRIRVGSVI